jgi:hypothetical protein
VPADGLALVGGLVEQQHVEDGLEIVVVLQQQRMHALGGNVGEDGAEHFKGRPRGVVLGRGIVFQEVVEGQHGVGGSRRCGGGAVVWVFQLLHLQQVVREELCLIHG